MTSPVPATADFFRQCEHMFSGTDASCGISINRLTY